MKVRLLIATVALLAIAAAAWFVWKPASSAKDGRLTIHFTCDVSGRLEPCGCFTGQHGGLTRLRTWLEGRKPEGDVLRLDVGGAIAGKQDYDLIQYRYLCRAYAMMGFSALNLGASEAALSADTLRQLASTSPVPLVSASLVTADRGEPLMEPFKIVKLAGRRIGILGLVSPHSVPQPGTGLQILSLDEAVGRQLPKLREQADLIVVLAFAKEEELRRLARDYFEFAAILGGDVSGPTQQLTHENDSIVLAVTNEARTVGTLTATVSGGNKARLTDPAYQVELLWDTIPQSPDLQELGRGYRNEIRRTPLAIDATDIADPDAIPGVKTTATYVGSETCKSCHGEAHAVWEKSGHGHAFATLVKKGSDADPHCIQCHTVGFGQPGGYRRPMGSKSLVDVGCESCHGPASEHIDRYLHGKPNQFQFRPLGPGDCKTCHQGEFSRPFDWDTFWPHIAHGKEGSVPPAPRIRE